MFTEKFVGGEYITASFHAGIFIEKTGKPEVLAHFGSGRTPANQVLNSADLRELAELFSKVADCLDKGKY